MKGFCFWLYFTSPEFRSFKRIHGDAVICHRKKEKLTSCFYKFARAISLLASKKNIKKNKKLYETLNMKALKNLLYNLVNII